MTTTSTIIIDKNEFEFLQWYEFITPEDIVELIEHRAVFEKYLRVKMRQIVIDLAQFKYVDKEKDAYISTQTIDQLIKWIANQIDEYKKYTDEKEKSKDIPTEPMEAKELKRLKKKYKI